jgi:hypothetical protein
MVGSPGLGAIAGLVAMLAAAFAALAMSWSKAPDPKLVFLNALMQRSPRVLWSSPAFPNHKPKCQC